jgi:hypothetical protein
VLVLVLVLDLVFAPRGADVGSPGLPPSFPITSQMNRSRVE